MNRPFKAHEAPGTARSDGIQAPAKTADLTVNPVMIIRTWVINLFHQDGVNETQAYLSLSFTFAPSGEVMVEGDALFFCGSWQFKQGFNTLFLNFPKGMPMLDRLCGQWNVNMLNQYDMRLLENREENFTVLQFRSR